MLTMSFFKYHIEKRSKLNLRFLNRSKIYLHAPIFVRWDASRKVIIISRFFSN